jgi:hypothetical protein
MYAQRGHGKRSSYYSDYTFGSGPGEDGEQLVPVGKAYFGFTDEELLQIDRFVRRNTTEKFGPVRHVVHEPIRGWCWRSRSRAAALAAAQIRRGDAVSAHQPAALGQAAARGRPAGNAGADAEADGNPCATGVSRPLTRNAGFPMSATPDYRCAGNPPETIDAQRQPENCRQPVTASTAFSAARRWRWRSG